MSFGTIDVTASGVFDIFLAKYDPQGNVLRVQTLNPSTNNQAQGDGVAVDTAGNVLVAGTMIVSDFQPFLVKFSADGNQLSAPQLDGTYGFAGPLAVDAAGNCYLAGSFRGTLTVGAVSFRSSGSGTSPWIAKVGPDGKLIWGWHGSAPALEAQADIAGVAVGDNGDVYTTGRILGNIYFGSFALQNPSSDWDFYISKHSADGTFQWAKQMAGQGAGICVDRFGNSYVTGGGIGASASATPSLALSYSAGGDLRWSKQSTPTNALSGIFLSVNKQGNLTLVGGCWKTITIDSFTITGGGQGLVLGLFAQPPELRISLNQPNVEVRWSTNSSGYLLESANALSASSWSAVTNPVEINGEDFVVKPGTNTSLAFFRLRRE
jgi:hypothetical protein